MNFGEFKIKTIKPELREKLSNSIFRVSSVSLNFKSWREKKKAVKMNFLEVSFHYLQGYSEGF